MPNKITIITGASAGIGAELARRLGAEKHSLVLAARRRSELEAVARDAERAGSPRAIAMMADVTKREAVDALADRAIAEFGGFDVWINNAGRGITRSVLDLTSRDVDDMMDVNVKSALYGMQAAARHFLTRGSGHILNVSSFLGRVPLALHRSAYNAAKAALNALTANMRMELHSRSPNIHVTLVMPGMVSTEFARNAVGAPADAPIYSGPHVQTVAQIADIVADVIEHPVAEVFTNASSFEMSRTYYADVGEFELNGVNPWAAPRGVR